MYTLTPEDITSKVSDPEKAFGTTALLPPVDEIPEEFKAHRGNVYVITAEAIFQGGQLPPVYITFKEGFTAKMMQDVVGAHLRSWEPKHQHKIAGVGYMLSLMATFEEIKDETNH